jgi:hypothetical protein
MLQIERIARISRAPAPDNSGRITAARAVIRSAGDAGTWSRNPLAIQNAPSFAKEPLKVEQPASVAHLNARFTRCNRCDGQ